ncbi:MAG: hypothetical protein GX813_04900, partial [Erysipelotrichia bacterium]|nr:hypothetical protein [Erysipelotrichia bacterium]
MGKIRYSLTYIMFWLVIAFSSLLVENYDFFSTNPMGGFSYDSAIVLAIFTILLLIIYYFFEYKRNRVSIDKILLPIIAGATFLFVMTIWWQGERTFINAANEQLGRVVFSFKEKLVYSLQVVIWGGVIYGVLFTFNRYHLIFKTVRWLLFVYVAVVLIFTIADIVMEFDVIKGVFEGTYTNSGLKFIFYNSNPWASIVMVALISAMVLNLKKFNIFYYLLMIYFLFFSIFTTCTTTIFINFAIILFYTFFEIFAFFKRSVAQTILYSAIYLLFLVGLGVTTLVFMRKGNNPIANFWYFVSTHVLQKDFSTFTSRTTIWQAAFTLLVQNPRDLIFGLGYKTSINIFATFYTATVNQAFVLRTSHNGFVEILLRHGLIGLLLYVGALGTFVFAFIKLIIKKKYRFSFLYGLAACGLLAHSFMESTMFLSIGINSLYMTIVFFMPIVTEIQNRKIKILHQDLVTLD